MLWGHVGVRVCEGVGVCEGCVDKQMVAHTSLDTVQCEAVWSVLNYQSEDLNFLRSIQDTISC